MKIANYVAQEAVNPARKILAVTHVNCPERGKMVANAIRELIPVKDVIVLNAAGCSTMYANDGGIIVVI